jgi:Tol biopolymer transport system component
LSVATTLVLVALILLFTGSSAWATYPGQNGRIAYVANPTGTYQLYTINPDGTDIRQITNLPPSDNSTWFPDFSPDGRRIVFVHDKTGQSEIYVINTDGTGLMQLTNDSSRRKLFPRWSPDGTRIVFHRESLRTHLGVITTMRADGTGEVTELTDDLFDSYQPEYTPDGRQIVFGSQNGGLVSAVWIMNANGSHKRRLTAAPLEAGGPDVSPDGQHIAFYSQQNTVLPTSVWVMDIDGNHKSRLTGPEHFDVDPIYSPDGNKIVFHGDSLSDGPVNLFTMNADGSGIRRIATGLIFGGWPLGRLPHPRLGSKAVKEAGSLVL